ncbi:MAG TPA: tetratricopeptide repeat protein [Gemmataceae bacterium]|nr:tetratricopeptide repeat protein [Gemmataceae bacterium]
MAISPDGRLLATGYHGLRLFDLPSRQERPELQGHTGPVYAIAFARDGKRLASGGQDRTVRMWDLATGKQQACIANPGPVYGLALPPDAGVVAAMGTDAIRVWDVAPPTPATVLRHTATAHVVAFSPDGKMLASRGVDGTKLWDPAEGQEIMTLSTTNNTWYLGMAVSPDGRSLATTGTAEGTIDLWDMTGRRLAVLKGFGYGMAFSPDGKSLVAASDKGAAAVWDLASQQRRYTMPVSQMAYSVACSPDGKTIAAGGQFGVVKLFDAESGKELSTIQRQELAVDYALTLAFSPNGRKLATGNAQGIVHIWDVATNQLDASLIGHTDAVESLAFGDGGRTLATASRDRTIRLWDVATGQERIALKGHESAVTGVAFAPDGIVLATSSRDGTVRLWSAAADADARARQREVDSDAAQSPAACNELGDRLWQAGRTGEAESAYRQALERLEKLRAAFPDDPAYQQELVRSLLSISLLMRTERDDRSEAEPARLRAREVYRRLSPQQQEAMFFAYQERHRKLHGTGNVQQADRTFSQMIELMPEDDVVWLARAAHHLANCADARLRDPARSDDFARQADVGYTKAIELKSYDWEVWSGRAFVHFRRQQWEEAIADFSKAIDLAPHVHTNWWHRGHAYRALRQWDKSAADFGKAIELSPDGAEGWYWRGLAYCDLGRWTEATADFATAIRLQPDAAGWLHLAIARAYAKHGQWEKAAELPGLQVDFERSAPILNDAAWRLVANLNASLAEVTRGLKLAKQAVVVAPQDGPSWNTLGVAYYRARNWAAAIDALEKSSALQQDKAVSWDAYFLSMAHWQLGSKDEAGKWYDRAVEWMEKNQPQNEELHRFRAEAEELMGVEGK